MKEPKKYYLPKVHCIHKRELSAEKHHQHSEGKEILSSIQAFWNGCSSLSEIQKLHTLIITNIYLNHENIITDNFAKGGFTWPNRI